jgi:tRNA A37 methylthiotransferase MiaB
MGAESGSQRILDAMDKGIRVRQIHDACNNLRRNGIRACLFLQFGYPGEEWAEIQATIRMVREVKPDDVGISVSYPLPGTGGCHSCRSSRRRYRRCMAEAAAASAVSRGCGEGCLMRPPPKIVLRTSDGRV